MARWRVQSSRTQPNWFHACEVTFVDALTAPEAQAIVESDRELKAWAVTPATAQMEQRYLDWKQSCDEWMDRNRSGESNRGRKIAGY